MLLKRDLLWMPIRAHQLAKLGKLLQDVPSARLFDEILKLLMSGYSWAAIQGLRDAGLHHGLLAAPRSHS